MTHATLPPVGCRVDQQTIAPMPVSRIRTGGPHRWGLVGPSHVELLVGEGELDGWSPDYGLEKRTRHHSRIVSYAQLVELFAERLLPLRDLHLRYDIETLYRDRDCHPTPYGFERMGILFERGMAQVAPVHLPTTTVLAPV